MPGAQPENAYALLESSFRDSPQLKSHKSLRRRTDNSGNIISAASQRKPTASTSDDDTLDNQQSSPLVSPTLITGTDSGLPPTPPSNSQEHTPSVTFSTPGHADGVVASLLSNKSPLSTPVNQRSPPTPDPSPPRTTESMGPSQRPAMLAYPSSRAESFETALEEQSETEGSHRANTPLVDRLSTVEEDRGLGLAFEREDSDVTPTNRVQRRSGSVSGAHDGEEEKSLAKVPNREWDTNLMRNVTIHRKRKHISQLRNADSNAPASPDTSSTPRRSSSLRERVDASKGSPHTPSIEHFAKSIGWPTESKTNENQRSQDDEATKRLSSSSVASTVVEAMVIVTPPQRRRTLRHSGRNLAYRQGETSAEQSPTTSSKRNSMNSDDIPLHRLVHKRATLSEWTQNSTSESPVRTRSPRPKPRQVSAPITSTPRDDVKVTLQPAPEIVPALSNATPRSRFVPNSASGAKEFGKTYQKRISSAPERSMNGVYSATGQQKSRDFSPSTAPISARNGFDRTSRAIPAYPGLKTLDVSSPASKISEARTERPSSSGKQPTTDQATLADPFLRPTNAEQTSALAVQVPHIQHTSPSTPEITSEEPSPVSPRVKHKSPLLQEIQNTPNINKSLPELPIELPIQSTDEIPEPEEALREGTTATAHESHDTGFLITSNLAIEPDILPSQSTESNLHQRHQRTPSAENMPVVRRGSISIRGRTDERRRSSLSQDRTSTSRDTLLHPNVDRTPIEELPRRSYEWQLLSPDEHRRVSFDRSTSRTEEHANARHLFSQSTPFSQFSAFSDTPELEVSEATAVSIFPHNNHSLLVVQSRTSTQPREQPEQRQLLPSEGFSSLQEERDARDEPERPQQPTLTFEPSTPPMLQRENFINGAPGAVDSPLKNPRQAPEPPVIKFIPPTPAEELERQLVPGPPPDSEARPKRRLSLVQRARRYSDNFISPILARASSTRGRAMSETRHEKPRVPSVNDEDGSLHPFWRPRGFWEGFEEDSDSDSDDDVLPRGGDTSDVEDEETTTAPKLGFGVLGRRLTNNFKAHNSFHVGNSLGLERAGTNRRRPHIELPSIRRRASRPKIMIQPPTLPGRANSPRIDKYSSRNSMRSSASYERHHRERRRDSWRNGKTIPGLGMQVQYIGLSGVKERLRERKAEKRRDILRQSIGPRYFIEGVNSA